MAQHDFLHDHHIVPAFVPAADAFDGGETTEAVSLKNYRRAKLIVLTGAIEDAGISNIVTIDACTTASGGTTAAMPFYWRLMPYSTTVDTWTALALVAATGKNLATASAVANTLWMAEVTAEEVGAAVDGAQFVRAAIAETVNKTITAGGIWILSQPRYCGDVPLTAIA
jgi:hypothetical protein